MLDLLAHYLPLEWIYEAQSPSIPTTKPTFLVAPVPEQVSILFKLVMK